MGIEEGNTYPRISKVSYSIALIIPASFCTTNNMLVYENRRLNAASLITEALSYSKFNISLHFLFRVNIQQNEDNTAEFPNVGFVPLINFYFQWMPLEAWSVIVEGDALGTKQGRAEDIFAGVAFATSDAFSLKAGYRILEGGADVTDNYNFTFVNYVSVGAIITF